MIKIKCPVCKGMGHKWSVELAYQGIAERCNICSGEGTLEIEVISTDENSKKEKKCERTRFSKNTNTSAKYVEKTVIAEANQFLNENKDHVYHWASERQMNIYPSTDELGNPCIVIPMEWGEARCNIGDYVYVLESFPNKICVLNANDFELMFDRYENKEE